MKVGFFVAGVVTGLALYTYFRPRYRPTITVEDYYDIQDDVRLSDLVEQVERAIRNASTARDHQ